MAMEEVEGSPGFYTFVRHLGKMGPPSSLLFLTADRQNDHRCETKKTRKKRTKVHSERKKEMQ